MSLRRPWSRAAAAALLLLGLFLIAKLSGFTDRLDVERLRAAVEQAGPWGWLLFLAIFCAGELVQVPGMLFVGAAVLAYGRWLGFGLALAGAVGSVCLSFWVVRSVAGQVLAEIRRPWVRKILSRLDRRPVLTVALLRLLLWISPPLNYALALSTVRFRHYLLGSVLGLIPPVLLAALLVDRLFPA